VFCAAKAFFCNAIKGQGSAPRTINRDGHAAHPGETAREMTADVNLPADANFPFRQVSEHLIEQDHRGVKLRIGPDARLQTVPDRGEVIAGSNCCASSARDSATSPIAASNRVRPSSALRFLAARYNGQTVSDPQALPALASDWNLQPERWSIDDEHQAGRLPLRLAALTPSVSVS